MSLIQFWVKFQTHIFKVGVYRKAPLKLEYIWKHPSEL